MVWPLIQMERHIYSLSIMHNYVDRVSISEMALANLRYNEHTL